jgi:uncharacterized protein (DUF1778 family)
MKSERINLLVSVEEKIAIDARAEAANLTTSEFIRRAVTAYDESTSLDEVRVLAETLAAVVTRTDRKQMSERELLKQEFVKELASQPQAWPFQSLSADSNNAQ